MEIDPTSEDLGQVVLHPEELQPGRLAGLELHQDVDIALGPEILSKHRTEECQSLDPVTPAECRDGIQGYGNGGSGSCSAAP